MTGPSTQDSPEGPVTNWPVLRVGEDHHGVLFTLAERNSAAPRRQTETYIPVSALLSDEALGYIANELERLGWQLPANGAELCADLRAAITDAIEQVEGAIEEVILVREFALAAGLSDEDRGRFGQIADVLYDHGYERHAALLRKLVTPEEETDCG